MGRKKWAVVAVGAVAGVVVAVPIMLRQMPVAPASPAPTVEEQAVRVEHEFVSLPVAEEPPAHAAAVKSAYRAAPLRRAVRPAPITPGNKAKRALLGDGRYRPEPFPRVRANGH